MRVPAPPDALRVARALLNISQRETAEGADVAQKSVSAVENSKSIHLDTNLALVDYYRSKGIMFAGEGLIGDRIARSGAMWTSPEISLKLEPDDMRFHFETSDVSFRAARALLGKEQIEIADLANIGVDSIKNLESGHTTNRSYSTLRQWYEDQEVEFTGWGDVATRRFYGVGVRWKR